MSKGPGSRKIRRKKLRLWNENPHCRRCGILTILRPEYENGTLPHNAATIQHVKSKITCLGSCYYNSDENLTLWCYHCNGMENYREFVDLTTAKYLELEKYNSLSKKRLQTDMHFL